MDTTIKTKKSKNPKNAGRKLFDGKDPKVVIPKLEQAALIDATVEEMCYYAEISTSSYYRYIERRPQFRDKIKSLREHLTLKSRQNIANQIAIGDIPLSKWMLERKKSSEFAEKLQVEHSGDLTNASDFDPAINTLRLEYMEKMRGAIKAFWDKKEKA